ncbi:uncharacterized protein LOC110058205 isoform X2 [Orbicella faveolata]|uniref:uncharacterized protein LOC110058205 isoform X2 n=1 Tax=Orbicella faveolata TaxID=48498 RepID=UPI0009E430A5|nr:uncharacterized protein LOC110058205 isoform X2 [Orbicella faveolata]
MSGESLLASGQKLSSVIANLEKPSKFLKQLYFCCIQQEEKNQSSELAPRQAVTKAKGQSQTENNDFDLDESTRTKCGTADDCLSSVYVGGDKVHSAKTVSLVSSARIGKKFKNVSDQYNVVSRGNLQQGGQYFNFRPSHVLFLSIEYCYPKSNKINQSISK